MNKILVLGAGRSSGALIKFLLEHTSVEDCLIIIGDLDIAAAREKVAGHPKGEVVYFNIEDEPASVAAIRQADVVISLLPPPFHPKVAKHCLKHRKHLLTASYVSPEMQLLHDEALDKNLLFLNECGLDPGIDHMSAMQIIHRIQASGGEIISFESFTGGLIAPDTDPENPWRYKFTWNPKNVVMAGQGTAKFIDGGSYKYIPYQQLFKRLTPIRVEGAGEYEGYANRDSLKYRDTYGLSQVQTMIRGTLRNKGFCEAWDILVQLGCCDDSYLMEHVSDMTHTQFVQSFLPPDKNNIKQRLQDQLNISASAFDKLNWSGFFSDEPVGLSQGSPAQILEHILQKKWQLKPEDNDMIVMWHQFRFRSGSSLKQINASLIVRGENATRTAMAKTVGLPLGIAASLLLKGKITARGVVIPVSKEFYEPILMALEKEGVVMSESEIL